MISEIERFHAAADGSLDLRQGIQSANSPDELVAFAAARGYDFSADEFLKLINAPLAKGELSTADLDKVVGGVSIDQVICSYYKAKDWVKTAGTILGLD